MTDLLVQAAGLDKSQALEVWNSYGQEPISPDKLFPLVYYNLAIKHRQVDFHRSAELKNIYLTAFAKNRYLFNHFKKPLSQLLEHKIPVIVLKGLAYLTLYYRDLGARALTDIDILVPESHFHLAASLLDQLGWKTFRCRTLKHFNPRLTHALDYFDASGHNIDLHCHLLHTNCEKSANDDYWAAAENFTFQGLSLQTLCPTDHLIHCCSHALISNSAHALYWTIDALSIIQQNPIDWSRVTALAKKNAIASFLLQSFGTLNRLLPNTIPDFAIDQLKTIKVSSLDRRIFQLLQKQEHLLSYHQYLLCNAYRNCKDKNFLACFIEYLKLIASTDRLFFVPHKIAFKILRKSIRWFKKSLSI